MPAREKVTWSRHQMAQAIDQLSECTARLRAILAKMENSKPALNTIDIYNTAEFGRALRGVQAFVDAASQCWYTSQLNGSAPTGPRSRKRLKK